MKAIGNCTLYLVLSTELLFEHFFFNQIVWVWFLIFALFMSVAAARARKFMFIKVELFEAELIKKIQLNAFVMPKTIEHELREFA